MISLNQNFKSKVNVCTSNLLAVTTFQPETVKLNVKKKLPLSRCSEGLSTDVASIFMQGCRKSDIMDFLY